jgi:hypothetical protein
MCPKAARQVLQLSAGTCVQSAAVSSVPSVSRQHARRGGQEQCAMGIRDCERCAVANLHLLVQRVRVGELHSRMLVV